MSSARDFDFFMGSWTVRNRYLGERLRGSDDWVEFEATSDARPLPGVLGTRTSSTPSSRAASSACRSALRPGAGRWSIYWADSRRPGVLDPPVFGGFANGSGVFEGTDVLAGRPILVRFTWSKVDTDEPRWEQAFSGDAGETWETNWVMEFARR